MPDPDDDVAGMSAAEQAAYWKDKAHLWENRNRSMVEITGGKYGDDLKALLDERETLLADRREGRSAAAVAQAAATARAEVRQEQAGRDVRMALALLLGENSGHIDLINPAAFMTEDHRVDVAKVRQYAATVQPLPPPNFGAGRRTPPGGWPRFNPGGSVDEGRCLYNDGPRR